MSETQTVSATPDIAQDDHGGIPFKGSFKTSDYQEEPQNDVAQTTEDQPQEPVTQGVTSAEGIEATGGQPTETQTEETEKTNAPTVELWKSLAERAGIDVESEDEIIEYLQNFGSIKESLPQLQEKAKYYESLDPLALDIDKAKKAGIDENLYLTARSLDIDGLEEDDAIWMQFKLQNAQLLKDDPKFAKMKFDREQQQKYGLLSKKLDEVEAEESKEEIEFQKRSKQTDAISAKRFLQEWKEKNVTIPESQKTPSTEELDQIRNDYFKRADEFIESTDTLDIFLDEDTVFKYGLDDIKEDVRQDLKNPIETMKRYGVDLENATIDADKLGELLITVKAIEGLAKPLSDFILEKRNKDLVTSKTKPEPPQPQAGGALPEKTENQLVGEAFKNFWKSRSQGG